MSKRRIGFLAALGLTLIAMATAFAQQARPAVAHSRGSEAGRYVKPAIMYHYGPGGCEDAAAYDGSDL